MTCMSPPGISLKNFARFSSSLVIVSLALREVLAEAEPTSLSCSTSASRPKTGMAFKERAALLQQSRLLGQKVKRREVPSRHSPVHVALLGVQGNSDFELQEFLQTPRVLLNKQNKSILFYHVHVPRTGGTTVANLLVADICSPDSTTVGQQDWNQICGTSCDMGLSDNMLTCNATELLEEQNIENRLNVEHAPLSFNYDRADKLKTMTGAEQIVYVTTLRPGWKRVLSQWHMWRSYHPNCFNAEGNESLMLYVDGWYQSESCETPDWIADAAPVARNNLQVSMLSSVQWNLLESPTIEHLEIAKQTLLTGTWIIGFTECLDKLHEKLMQYGYALHGYEASKPLPLHESDGKTGMERELRPDVLEHVKSLTTLDDALYEWAKNQANTSSDTRWVGC